MQQANAQNYSRYLAPEQNSTDGKKHKTSKEPVEIVTLAEAKKAEVQKYSNEKPGYSRQKMFVILHGPLQKICLGCNASKMEEESNVHEFLR